MSQPQQLPLYQCHKRVRAARILAAEWREDGGLALALGRENDALYLDCETATRFKKMTEGDLGYVVVYDDGYISWSPTKAFEEGYSLVTADE